MEVDDEVEVDVDDEVDSPHQLLMDPTAHSSFVVVLVHVLPEAIWYTDPQAYIVLEHDKHEIGRAPIVP